jgi:hypothetical protein
MPRNPTKAKGASGPCFKCGNTMYCNEKEYQGLVSLQWQDNNGKAHYTRDGNCAGAKDFSPTINNMPSVAQQVTTQKVNWEEVPEELTEDEQVLLGGLKRMRILSYKDAKEVHPDLDENSNTFGQIVNAGITHLVNLALVKATKESN